MYIYTDTYTARFNSSNPKKIEKIRKVNHHYFSWILLFYLSVGCYPQTTAASRFMVILSLPSSASGPLLSESESDDVSQITCQHEVPQDQWGFP